LKSALRQRTEKGMTIIEMIVFIAILGIFMAIAIPSVIKSSRTMAQAKRLTARYPNAHRALEEMSDMLRRAYPEALDAGESFVGINGSYDAGTYTLPSDQLIFPALDTNYSHLRSVQRISFGLDKHPESNTSIMDLVQTRSFLGASADTGIKESILQNAVGLDLWYLDDTADPPEWVNYWPPVVEETPASDTEQHTREILPGAVKITVFMLGDISRQPTSFTTVVNIPSR
jgi:prepilin-type N-terminal cleavage/methylation domain-containing protein